jgi:uncharacterized membrane protein YbhN (UPF0104 family)
LDSGRPEPTTRTATEEELAPRRAISGWKLLLRIAVGGTIIAILLTRSDVDTIARVLSRAHPGLVALSLLLMIGMILVTAVRWRIFLRLLGLLLAAGTLLRVHFTGTFFNTFLPTGVGGDAYKAIRLGRSRGALAAAVASVLLDRMAGAVGLAIVGLAAVAARLAIGDDSAVVLVAGLLGVAALAVAALIVGLGERLVGRGASTWLGIRPRLRRLLRAMAVGRDPSTIRRATVAGVAAQALILGAHVASARALDLAVPVPVLATGLLIATLAAAMPVTINGLGVREAVWVWSLGEYGFGTSEALAFALLVLGVYLATSAIGGIVYLVGGGEIGPSPPIRP